MTVIMIIIVMKNEENQVMKKVRKPEYETEKGKTNKKVLKLCKLCFECLLFTSIPSCNWSKILVTSLFFMKLLPRERMNELFTASETTK